MFTLIRKSSLTALLCVFTLAPLHADETTDSIEEGLKAYKDGKYTDAAKSLQYALGLINEKKSDAAMEALPDKIGDWVGGKAEANNLGILGGGSVIERRYTKDEKRASISLTIDSPLVQQMMGLMSNPMFAAQAGRPRKVNGNDALYNKDNGELTMIVDNRILVKIEGRELAEDDLLELAKGVDLDKVKGN